MPCARCSDCAVNYPLGLTHCKICGSRLSPMSHESHHPDWQDRVNQAGWERTADQHAADIADQVISWRLCELLRVGLQVPEAEELARRRDVDLEQVRSLIRRGCPPGTAVRIVA